MPYVRKFIKKTKKSALTQTNPKKIVRKALNKAKNASVARVVKRILGNNLETKVAVKEVFNRIAVPGAGLDTAAGLGLGTTTGIIPAVPRGTDDATRSGDIIHAKRLLLKYSIRARDITAALGNNAFKQPFMVRMIVFNHRFAQDEASATNILDKGATSGNLDSSPDSWLEPYQKKEYRIWYSKTFKMAPFVNSAAGTGINSVLEQVPNGYKYFVAGRTSIKIPKRLLYTNAASLPSNSMPQLCFAVCNVDGTPMTNAQFRCEVNVETQLYYTDA